MRVQNVNDEEKLDSAFELPVTDNTIHYGVPHIAYDDDTDSQRYNNLATDTNIDANAFPADAAVDVPDSYSPTLKGRASLTALTVGVIMSLILCICCVVVILAIVLGASYYVDSCSMGPELLNTDTFDVSEYYGNITTFRIEGSGHMRIDTIEGEKVVVAVYRRNKKNTKDTLVSELELVDNVLTQKTVIPEDLTCIEVLRVIQIPVSWIGNITLDVETDFWSIESGSQFSLDGLKVKTQTGHVTFEDIQVTNSIEVETTYGSVNLNGVTSGGTVSISTIYGEANIFIEAADDVTIESEYGEISGQINTDGTLRTKTEFGDQRLEVTKADRSILRGNAGDIELRVQKFAGRYDLSSDSRISLQNFANKEVQVDSGTKYSSSGKVVDESAPESSVSMSAQEGSVVFKILS
jgi:hypothetical protein